MRFYNGDDEVSVLAYTLRESFDRDWSELEVRSSVYYAGVWQVVVNDVSFDVMPVEIKNDGLLFEYRMVASKLVELASREFLPVQGEYTLGQLLQLYDVPYGVDKDTPAQYWEIPKMRIADLIQYLRPRVNTGSAPVMTFSILGALIVKDIADALDTSEVVDIPFESISNCQLQDWQFEVPLNIVYTLSTLQEDRTDILSLSKSFGWGVEQSLVTNDRLAYQDALRLRNIMGVYAYTSNVVRTRVPSAEMWVLGVVCNVQLQRMMLTQVDQTLEGTALSFCSLGVNLDSY